ncbi:hypothetical protein F4778DRAFT_761651 [Xylariomycetidae sp. FL2044]|nr:hypothetical protein F4778DRAFT_761651 [Xylariomycetidae sp. FL2044]
MDDDVDSSPLPLWPGAIGYIVSLSVLTVLASVVVALRFWSRLLANRHQHQHQHHPYPYRRLFYAEDWLTLTALLLSYGLFADLIACFAVANYGWDYDRVIMSGRAASFVIMRKLEYISSTIYGFASFGIRLAVLVFYGRIFPTRLVRWGSRAVGGVCAAWLVAVEVLLLAQCQPIARVWDHGLKDGHCIDLPVSLTVAIAVVNCFNDAAILLLPLREVLGLNMSKSRRYSIGGVFSLGAIAVAGSLVRAVIVWYYARHNGEDINGDVSALLSAAAIIEVYFGVIGASAPTLVPAYKRIRHGRAFFFWPSWSASGETTTKTKTTRPNLVNGVVSLRTMGRTSIRRHLYPNEDGNRQDFEVLHSRDDFLYPLPT